jgi:large subunit ribosomal protein L6
VSRIGKVPVKLPKGVDVTLSNESITVKGPKGSLSLKLNEHVQIEKAQDEVRVKRQDDERTTKAFHGLYQRLIASMVKGVTQGYQKELEIIGVGYRAQMEGKKLVLQVGYSHPISFVPPPGITVETPKPTSIVVKGIDKQQVGQVAATIRKYRPPEPYKGKGIRYSGEYVRKKVGKTGAK